MLVEDIGGIVRVYMVMMIMCMFILSCHSDAYA